MGKHWNRAKLMLTSLYRFTEVRFVDQMITGVILEGKLRIFNCEK